MQQRGRYQQQQRQPVQQGPTQGTFAAVDDQLWQTRAAPSDTPFWSRANPTQKSRGAERADTASEALTFWMQELLDSPERFLTQPLADCDCLENDRA